MREIGIKGLKKLLTFDFLILTYIIDKNPAMGGVLQLSLY